MRRIETELPGVVVIEPDVYADERGYFMESWNARRYRALGIAEEFVQDNLSYSGRGVLRGLHYQHPQGQGKLVSVLWGAVFDVAVDVRRGSPTFGRWVGYELSSANRRQLYIPEGFAHGFAVVSEGALFHYKCTAYYERSLEGSIRWDDPDLGIRWPVEQPVLSTKDANAPLLRDVERLPDYKEN